jgi:hypothetical protein
MNPIRSNYEGRHIHSPFAFHLVSEVIFGSAESGRGDQQKESWKDGGIQPKYGLVIRLMEFFKPEAIVIRGTETSDLENLISKYLKPEKPVPVRVGYDWPVGNNEFVIWTEIMDNKNEIPGNISESVWFLFDIQQNGMREFYENLKLNVKVTQTYELNSCGIVIFNPKFQKQDFVIKGKKSY